MATVEASHLQSTLWESVTQHELVVNERVRQCRIQGEPADANIYEEWDTYLSKLGAGEEGIGVGCDGTQHDAAKLIKLPSDIVFQSQDLDAFIDEFYPDIVANYTNVDWLKARTILAPKNDDVEEINTKVLRKLSGAKISFLSADDTIDDSSGLWSTDILNTWNANGMPPHELKLKEGTLHRHAPAQPACDAWAMQRHEAARRNDKEKDANLHHCLRPPEADWSTRPHLPHPIAVNKK